MTHINRTENKYTWLSTKLHIGSLLDSLLFSSTQFLFLSSLSVFFFRFFFTLLLFLVYLAFFFVAPSI